MDPTSMAIELSAARWEQWVGAAQRVHHWQALLDSARPRRRRARARARPRAAGTRSSFVWMLAVSALGFWLLRA